MRKYNENIKNFLGLCPKPHQGSVLDLQGGSQRCPQNLQLIILIALRSFSQNSEKTNKPTNFPFFPPLVAVAHYQMDGVLLLVTHLMSKILVLISFIVLVITSFKSFFSTAR